MKNLPLTRDLPAVSTPLLVARLMKLELSGMMRRLARVLGVRRPITLTPEQLAIPDSELAQKATALARELEPTFIFNHSVRCFLYGIAVGHHVGIKPDRELLYLAAILHDLGLTPEHDGDGDFEINGAQAAHSFLTDKGLDEPRAAMVHEAIALHTSAGVAGSREPEIALTHFGAGLDVFGLHREDVANETNTTIVSAWPREQFKERFVELLKDQATKKPQCHIAGALKIGFDKKILSGPFDE